MTETASPEVDAYIAAALPAAQPMLRQLRDLIRAAVPEAKEKISYGIPLYEHHGRLLYMAGYKDHVGLYPVDPEDPSAEGLRRYGAGKATLRFPVGQQLPVPLIRKLVKARARQNEARTRSRPKPGKETV